MLLLNKNLKASVELYDWEYDDDDNEIPKVYQVYFELFGCKYEAFYTVEDILNFNNWGLSNSGLEGDSELFDSMDNYFSDNNHTKEAEDLLKEMSDMWNLLYPNSPYDYVGNKKK